MNTPRTTIIIVAAGSGSRFGSELPKQFCQLDGVPVVMHSINRFRSFLPDCNIILVLSADRVDYWNDLCREHNFSSPQIAIGGRTRWESVRNALALVDDKTEYVMVHDAARPLVNREAVNRLLAELQAGAEGAIPVLPMTDSLRIINADGQSNAVDRSRYVSVQTPQAFPRTLLAQAYSYPYCGTMTDDASVMEAAGHFDLRLVAGSPETLKITHPADIAIAQAIMNKWTD